MPITRVRLITEAEDIYLAIDFEEPPRIIVYGKAAFLWSPVAQAFMEQTTMIVPENQDV